MGASSVTGVGAGDSGKLTTNDLSILANGPSILITGVVASTSIIASSPPSAGGGVVFAKPLPGSADNYVVILTTLNGGTCYVSAKNEEDGNFVGFEYLTEAECDLMYLVAKIGMRA